MTAVAFKLLNASECRRLADWLEAAIGRWRGDWLASGGNPGALNIGAAAQRSDWQGKADWLAFPVGEDTIYLAESCSVSTLLRRAVAGPADRGAPRDDSVAAQLLGAAMAELVDRLAGATAGEGLTKAPPKAVWQRGSGAAWFSLSLPGGELGGVLDAGLVRRLLRADPVPEPASRPARPLANPRACIGSQPVEIQVWLGSAELALPAFQALAVDDVLVLDARIDEPLHVTIAGQPAAPRAVLGRADAQKAVRLTAFTSNH